MQHHNDKPVLVPAQDDSTSDEIISSQDAIESTINRYITLLTKKNKSAIGENVLFKQSCQFKDSIIEKCG